MLRYYLLFAYRNFRRYKNSFLINLIGLACGLACFLIISLWVDSELSTDAFHDNNEHLYQILQNFPSGEKVFTYSATQGLLAEALAAEMPEVVYAASLEPPEASSYNRGLLVTADDTKQIAAGGHFVSRDFFRVFTFHFLSGQAHTASENLQAVSISDILAQKLFDTPERAVGQIVQWRNNSFGGSYVISGVFEALPATSTLQPELLFHYDLYLNPEMREWQSSAPATFVVLRDGASLDDFNARIADFPSTKTETNQTLFAQRFSERYLYGNYENGKIAGGRITYLRLFSAIAILILVIACVNFMNLSTAQATRRMREVGVKKAIGASRRSLAVQFLGEAMLMSLLALFIALPMVELTLPLFNELTGRQLVSDFTARRLAQLLIVAIVTGLLAGSYPALHLSRFKIVSVLKGRGDQRKSAFTARRGLVVFQFTISAMLIAAVLIFDQQIEFVKSKDPGYQRENLMLVEARNLDSGYRPFLDAVEKIPGVTSVSNMWGSVTEGASWIKGVRWEGKTPSANDHDTWHYLSVDYDLLETLGLQFLEGRPFSRDFPSDTSDAIIVNETAAKIMGFNEPLGKSVTVRGDRRIIGVVKDFHFKSLHETVKPFFFRLARRPGNSVVVRVLDSKQQDVLEQLSALFPQFSNGYPLQYRFVENAHNDLYQAETRILILSRYFAGIAILISCLGLFGLAAFTAEQRIKEIGLRKVLGSSVSAIVMLLSLDFIKMVMVALIIGLPLSYALTGSWLNTFAYRIDLSGWYFALAGGITLVIAWLTVAAKAFQAANVNPVECLRD